MATGAEGLFVQRLTRCLALTWELCLGAVVHELFKFVSDKINWSFPSALTCASPLKVITQVAPMAACGSQHSLLTEIPLLSRCANRPVLHNGRKPGLLMHLRCAYCLPWPWWVVSSSIFLPASARGNDSESWTFGLSPCLLVHLQVGSLSKGNAGALLCSKGEKPLPRKRSR